MNLNLELGCPEAITNELIKEMIVQDKWTANIYQMSLPKEVLNLAYNSWIEQKKEHVILHLRSKKSYLNTNSAKKILADRLSKLIGNKIILSIVEDEDFRFYTPFELIKKKYENKLTEAKQSIKNDHNITMLCNIFEASIENIYPIFNKDK